MKACIQLISATGVGDIRKIELRVNDSRKLYVILKKYYSKNKEVAKMKESGIKKFFLALLLLVTFMAVPSVGLF